MTVHYEWSAELVDADGDIGHTEFCATYKEIVPVAAGMEEAGHTVRIVLVRDDDNNGKSWAYLGEDLPGALPYYFTDAMCCDVAKVPARFHCQVTGYHRYGVTK